MLGWWMRTGRKVRPWVVVVGMSGALLLTGCPAPVYGPGPVPPGPVYGPAPIGDPAPDEGECRDDGDCVTANGEGWTCAVPASADDSAWGECLPPTP